MERKIEAKLLEWKYKINRKPLIIHGARQVGKTYTVLNFGKNNYKNVVYFNFESNSGLNAIFERDLNTERIINELSVYMGKSILEKETLLFFDEIQVSERALTSLKYFCEEAPNYHIISAGSLLGVAINRQKYSFPVGKVELLSMYPLDFEEFLWAINQKKASENIRKFYSTNTPNPFHEQFLDFYKTYLSLGGMPQIIKEFIENQNIQLITSLQKTINDSYIADMAKYANSQETVKILATYNSIPAQLAKENKKFQYKLIKNGARSGVYEVSIDWLKASGIIICCEKINEGKMPLIAYCEHGAFKIYLSDTGLLFSKYGINWNVINSEISGYNQIKGILAENYVAASLTYNGIKIYYWESEGKAEIDFVYQNDKGEIIPIEVKSSENVKAKSLLEFVKKYNPVYSIRISTKNFGFENGIKSVPLYAVFCIDGN